jgi:hypothetical protein
MTKKETELRTDLEFHENRLKDLKNPKFVRENYYTRFNKINVPGLIDTYKRIIKSIKQELKK